MPGDPARRRARRAGARGRRGDAALHHALPQGAHREPRRGRRCGARSRRRRCSTASSRARRSSSTRSSATRRSRRSCASGSSRPSTSTCSRTSTTPTASRRRTGPCDAREAGLAAARGLDLELRPRHRDAPGGPDPRAVGLHLPQRGEGDRRRQGRDRGRARHPRRAPGGRPGAAGPGAARLLRAGLRARRRRPRRRSRTRSSRAYFAFQERVSVAARAGQLAPLSRASGAASRRASCRSPSAGRPRTPSSRRGSSRASRRAPARCPTRPGAEVLRHAGRIAFKNNVRTSIENEVHRVLKEAADATAAQVFAENVKRLLIEPPFGPKPVLGVDPGIRTGCKLVDRGRRRGVHRRARSSTCRRTSRRRPRAETLVRLARERGVAAVAVGQRQRADARRRSSRAPRCAQAGLELPVVLVSEAGASVYARARRRAAEFPELDAGVRGAISIARRLQDPLAELVKVEPRSIGVGQYQHDVAHAALQQALDAVIEELRQRRGREPQHRLAAPARARRGHRPGTRRGDRASSARSRGRSARASSCSR